jgi:hypothetical protein
MVKGLSGVWLSLVMGRTTSVSLPGSTISDTDNGWAAYQHKEASETALSAHLKTKL